jgi:hypothetical protein
MANVFYDQAKKNLWNGTINLAADPIKVMLVDNSYAPSSSSTHEFKSDVTGEISGTGYSAGGQSLSGQAVAADSVNHRGAFTAANASWSSASFTAYGAVLYKDTGSDATSPLIGFIDFGGAKSCSNGSFTIQWDPDGIAYF